MSLVGSSSSSFAVYDGPVLSPSDILAKDMGFSQHCSCSSMCASVCLEPRLKERIIIIVIIIIDYINIPYACRTLLKNKFIFGLVGQHNTRAHIKTLCLYFILYFPLCCLFFPLSSSSSQLVC